MKYHLHFKHLIDIAIKDHLPSKNPKAIKHQ